MDVTEVQPSFMRIISHNSVNVNWIPTNLGTEIRFNESFICKNFSPIGVCIGVLWQILQSVRKEEKNEEIKMNVWPLVSQQWLGNFSSNLVCRLPFLVGTSVANLVPIR